MNTVAATGPTLTEALAEHRRHYGLPDDQMTAQSWICRIGPISLRLPNFAWRRSAILAHDIHHVLTGYPCSVLGEIQMAAWEFAAGPMPHWGAALFCFPLIPLGLLIAPLSVVRAFRYGSRSRSLHPSRELARWLTLPLETARAAISGKCCEGD